MKHVTDLFWIPKDGLADAVHWRFDGEYSVTNCEEFPCNLADDMMQKMFQPTATSETDILGKPFYRRQFLEFPDGFWSQMHANEPNGPVVSPISQW
jgi:hypothetical protein